jgi:hypothetical protein
MAYDCLATRVWRRGRPGCEAMADVLIRTAFLLLYAAAWLLVMTTMLALRISWAVARWSWRTIPPAVVRYRQRRLAMRSLPVPATLVR